MKIQYEDIILRDMMESDIEDYVRWFTTETEWSNTDAPWEPIGSDEETERTSWREYYESVKDLPDNMLRWKFEIEWNGRHVGWVSSYPIDENYEWIGEIKDGQTVYRAIGIDICEPDVWGNGIGTNALRAFMNYYFEKGVDELYTQTWSGNIRMLRCTEKLGFVECNRNVGIREVDGQKYDGLTFRKVNKVRYIKSCGFVTYKQIEGVNHYLIIKSLNGDVGFPKGHMEHGESELETAIRELKEETGVDVKVIQGFRREIEYKLHRIPDTIKQSVYFLGECTSDKIICQEAEVAEAGFIPYEDALKILTFEETKSILKDAEAIIKLSES